MNVSQKVKIQKIINRIQNGDFDETHVDTFFMYLRAYSKKYPIFQEVSHFVAHNDQRDMGLTFESLEVLYLKMKFFYEYQSLNKRLYIDNPFPLWIKKLMLYLLKESDQSILRRKFNISKKVLRNHIRKDFKDNDKDQTTVFKGTMSKEILDALDYIMECFVVKGICTQDQLINEVIEVIKFNELIINTDNFMNQSNYFMLCTIHLLHNSTFDFKGHKVGRCFIRREYDSKEDSGKLVGKLMLEGTISSNRNGEDLTVSFPLITTNLDIEEWCDDSLFYFTRINKNTSSSLVKKLHINDDILISDSRKLTNKDIKTLLIESIFTSKMKKINYNS